MGLHNGVRLLRPKLAPRKTNARRQLVEKEVCPDSDHDSDDERAARPSNNTRNHDLDVPDESPSERKARQTMMKNLISTTPAPGNKATKQAASPAGAAFDSAASGRPNEDRFGACSNNSATEKNTADARCFKCTSGHSCKAVPAVGCHGIHQSCPSVVGRTKPICAANMSPRCPRPPAILSDLENQAGITHPTGGRSHTL
ncbi:hypothetical protein B0H66DRAFT_537375 [Apodospora peruviana]|uniref:Uncharacterized protein n=1 Tax=Apodospora peruviana TaxID=516989 RepID=A0AAE0HWM8_9PEZI|nr:hypothetical protein B0H66DRAFT_537375 [Apodospora peruviana]